MVAFEIVHRHLRRSQSRAIVEGFATADNALRFGCSDGVGPSAFAGLDVRRWQGERKFGFELHAV